MADLTPEEKETKLLAAIDKVATLAKFNKFTLPADASDAVKTAFAAKGEALALATPGIDPDCITMSKDGADITVHPTQVDAWAAQGWQAAE